MVIEIRKSAEQFRGGRVARKDKDAKAAAVRGTEFGHLSGLRVPVANAAQQAVAGYFLHLGVVLHRNLFVLFCGLRDLGRAGKIGFAYQYGHMGRVLREEHCLLRSGKAAAHHKDLAAGEELAVTGRAVGNTVPLILRFAGEAYHTGVGAGCKYHAVGQKITLGGRYTIKAVLFAEGLYLGKHKFRAELLRLQTHALGKRFAAHGLGTRVIDYLGGNRNLAAEFILFQNQDAIAGSRKIETGGQPRRAAADDNRVIERCSLC